MALTEQDRIEINDLLNRHGHLVDAGELAEAGELFTEDVVYDVSDLGFGSLQGKAALLEATLAVGDANPVGHHVTNIVITGLDGQRARVRSKGIGVLADGTAGSVGYDDVVLRGPDGWKISHRKVIPRLRPLGGRATSAPESAGPRAVLERWRQAGIDRSTEDMRRVYAVDAVHEFPFAYPGVPSRLDGREEIVRWIADGWAANPLTYEGYRTVAVHETGEAGTIVVEQEALGRSAAVGEFALPNIIVLSTREHMITRLRDYVHVPAAAAALGHG